MHNSSKDFSPNYVLFAAISVFLPIAVGSPAQAQDCSLKPVASLDMRTVADGGISIPVKVEGQDFDFLLDTAGIESTISPNIADKFKFPQREASSKFFVAGGAVLHHVVTLDDFSIGGLSTHHVSFYVQPEAWPFIGTIAPNLLRRYDVDLDFAAGKFNLISQDHCLGKVVYWTKDPAVAIVPMMVEGDYTGHIRIPVLVDGKKMEATIDTGSDTSLMSMAAAQRYLGIDEQSPDLKAEDVVMNGTATVKQYRYPFKTLDFTGVTVTNPNIVIYSDGDSRANGSDIILGVGILRQLHMYIAYKEGKMYLTSATAH